MTDIVERLRCGVDTNEPPDKTDRLMDEAAAEIERLRAALVDVLPIADLAQVGKRKKARVENARCALDAIRKADE